MKLKKTAAALLAIMLTATQVFATVIGQISGTSTVDFGAGAVLHTNNIENGSKKQKEFYVEYTPNSASTPVVLNGAQIYGKRTILQAAKYYDSLDYRPLIGINADYFSFKTGIPMGHTIAGGELVTKDPSGQNAVGFFDDGNAFISWLEIQSTLSGDTGSVSVDCINKWCQPGSVGTYFLTDYFGADTKTSGACRYIIFSKKSGNIKIGEESVFVVEEKFDAEFNIAIPDGKYVLVMDKTYGNAQMLEFMNNVYIGQELTLKNEAVYDKEKWNNASNGLGSVGGRLVENSTAYTELEKTSAPRTAVGVKADGTVIFYVVDGRQSGYSNGLSLIDLAKRMEELGCTDAINLDGGGSTAIAGVYPGSDTFDVINKPSDGTLRSCANYIFLQDNRMPTGIEGHIVLGNKNNVNYLSGKKVTIGAESVWDTNNYKMEIGNISYEIVNSETTNATIDANTVTLSGNGTVKAIVSQGAASAELLMNVYNFPDKIIAKTEKGEINSLSLNLGQGYDVTFSPQAYLNGYYLESDPECFSYEISGNIGTMEGSRFIAETSSEKDGSIIIKASNFIKEIPVSVRDNTEYFSDMKNHWAKNAVYSLYKDKIISGFESGGSLIYAPDKQMSRIEFSALLCRYKGIDISLYETDTLHFDDTESLAPWMQGYAKAMSALGYVNGIGGSFMPNEPITRAQMATIIGRMLPEEEVEKELTFSDTTDIPSWARHYVATLVLQGIINGYHDNTVRPLANVSRAEAAQVIFNISS